MMRLLLSFISIVLSTALYSQTAWVYSEAYDGFVNVRKAPSSKAEIIEVMYNGKEGAKLLAVYNKWWYKVKYKGKTGYVSSMYTTLCDTTIVEEPNTQRTRKLQQNRTVNPSVIKIGMSAEACMRILGEPDDKSRHVYSDHVNEHWMYNSKYYLIFRDGYLTSFTEFSKKTED